jgi:hypothetical protein
MQTDDKKESNVGRPTKYNEQTIARLCEALADGLPIKSACVTAGIGVTTLNEWRDRYPEVEERMNEAREQLREKALQTVKAAFENGEWRAAVAALKLVFPEYREGAKIDVNATASVSTGFVLSEADRIRLIERWEKAQLANSGQ